MIERPRNTSGRPRACSSSGGSRCCSRTATRRRSKPRWSRTRRPTAATATRWSPTGAGRRASRRTSGPRSRRSRTRARPTRASCDHLETMTAPDGGVPVALPSLEPWPHAPWWRIGTEGTLLATALLYAPLVTPGVDHPWLGRAEAFCWAAVDAIEKTHPYEVEAAIVFLDAARDRTARANGRRAARAAGARAEPRRHAARGLHRGRDPPPARLRPPPRQPRPRVVRRRRDRRQPRPARGRQQDNGGWPITWAVWTPAIEIEWSGLMTIAALKTLQAYGRL